MESRPHVEPERLLAHVAGLRSLAAHLVRDPSAADDLTQDAALAAWQHAPSGEIDLRRWLSHVVRNFARRRARSETRRVEREARADVPQPEASPDELSEKLELQGDLVEAVRALEEPLRSTVWLRYFEGLDSQQIAHVQRVPPGTVRWRLQRALGILRARLDERYGSRDSWGALIAPLALRHPTATSSSAAAGAASSIVPGALTMGAIKIASMVCVGVALAGLAWWRFQETGSPAQVAGAAAPNEAIAESPRASEIDRPGEVGDARPREALAVEVESPAPNSAAPAEVAAPASARVDARLVDEQGRPWSDGVLRASADLVDGPDYQASSTCDADGRVVLGFTLPRFPKRPPSTEWGYDFVASRSGCVSKKARATLRVGETVHLGEIVLAPGTRLSGRVLDEHGAAIANAEVGLVPADVSDDRGKLRRHGSAEMREAPSVTSARDGSFELMAASGRLCAWAHVEGMRYSWTDAIEVSRDRDVTGLEIVLTPLAAEDWIEGLVLDSNGSAAPNTALGIYMHAGERRNSRFSRTDPEGRFSWLVEYDDSLYDLTAYDAKTDYAAGKLTDIAPGSRDVQLRMQPPPKVRVHVRDADGRPIDAVRAEVDMDNMSTEVALRSVAPGQYEMPVPLARFWLSVKCEGWRSAHFGPYEVATFPDPLEVVLERATAIRGVVRVAGGEALADARIELRRGDEQASQMVSGYRCVMWSHASAKATSDASGRFELFGEFDEPCWIRATAEDWAPAEIGPRKPSELAAQDLVLAFDRGGTIEGRVLVPLGVEAEGRIVGINHGDGEPRTQRAGAGGHFRFEGLAAGHWQVLAAEREIDPHSTTFSLAGEKGPIEWSCEVASGRTTHFDLDLTAK